ncbi:hypothetical protein [Limisalsivibrio acetivorans]|uniref:hypothetical protein n=1 Tax=Limisalsivibrio acetivorans TaxID=1304888 RepID=UPI0003B46FAC|nr:hypothetical protein [Limisalsivibrio acetivorans]
MTDIDNTVQFCMQKIDEIKSHEVGAIIQKLDEAVLGSSDEDVLARQKEIEALLIRIRDDFLIPNLEHEQFFFDYLSLGRIMHKAGLKKLSTPAVKGIEDKMKKLLKGEKNDWRKLLIHSMMFTAQCFTKPFKAARKSYISSLFFLDLHVIMSSEQNVNAVLHSMKLLFEDSAEMVDEVLNNVYKNSFWQKSTYEQKSSLLWVVSVMWNVYLHEFSFMKFYDKWKEFFYKAMEKKEDELVFFLHFPLSHIYLNIAQTDEQFARFNEEVELPFAEYVKDYCARNGIEPVKKPFKRKDKMKVGILVDRVVLSSPIKITLSFLHSLMENAPEFEMNIYDLEYVEKSKSKKEIVGDLGLLKANYVSNHELIDDRNKGHYYSHVNKCLRLRERIIEDDIDILVLAGNNREQFNFLFTSRTAPRQIFWSHGNYTYDIPGIDERMTHVTVLQEDQDYIELKGYNFKPLQHYMMEPFYNPEVDEFELQTHMRKYPSETVKLGYIGRLMKVESEEYLQAVVEIMKNNPDTIYIACGVGTSQMLQRIFGENDLLERLYLPGVVNPHIYGRIIDLVLNPFPFAMGEALGEYRSKGKIEISLNSTYNVSEDDIRSTMNNFVEIVRRDNEENAERMAEAVRLFPVSSTVEEYIENAGRFIQDKELREKVGRDYSKLHMYHFHINPSKMVSSFRKIIEGISR